VTWPQTAVATLASPAFTGTPTAPTAAPGTNTTQLATTAFCASSDTAPTATGSTPAPTSGVAFTPGSGTSDTMVYFQLAGGAAGTYTITIGPTTGAENSIANAVALVAAQTALVTVRVPANWKCVITLSVATLTQTKAVSC
jgi:hypothetical protein